MSNTTIKPFETVADSISLDHVRGGIGFWGKFGLGVAQSALQGLGQGGLRGAAQGALAAVTQGLGAAAQGAAG
jgi:hypothetical protein